MGRYSGKTCRLSSMLLLTTTYFLVEIIVGYVTNSMALVADSFHMLSDVIALVIGLFSVRVRYTDRLARIPIMWPWPTFNKIRKGDNVCTDRPTNREQTGLEAEWKTKWTKIATHVFIWKKLKNTFGFLRPAENVCKWFKKVGLGFFCA